MDLGGVGLGVTDLGGSGGLPTPTLTIPFPGPSTRGDAVSAVKGAQGAVSSTLARPTPLNSVTNSLAGSVTGAASGVTNTLLGPNGTPISPLGAVSRQVQNTDPGNRSGVPPAGERRYVPREVVIGIASDISPRALDDLARRHRLTAVETQQIALIGTTYHRWRIGDGRSVSDVIRALEADGAVRTAQPNYRFTLAQSPPAAGRGQIDPSLSYASGKLHLAEAHRLATGKKVLVAVINSGIDTSHPELADAVAASYDAVAPAGPPNLHGTGMAGAIVARSQMTGSAPGARLLAIRAFGGDEEKSEATTVSLLKSIDWAVAHGAQVINMSFAGPYDPDISRGIAAARQKGVVLVAAAGNAGPKSPPLYPAADKNVIAVTATNSKDQLLPEANRGRHIAVAAPGVDVIVPAPGKGIPVVDGHLGGRGRSERYRGAPDRIAARPHAGRDPENPPVDRPGSGPQGNRRAIRRRARRCPACGAVPRGRRGTYRRGKRAARRARRPVCGAVARNATDAVPDRAVRTRPPTINSVFVPSPACGEGQGGGKSTAQTRYESPLPTLPRKREREQKSPSFTQLKR